MSNLQSINAYVSKIIFHNSDNSFYILATESEDDKLTISGNFTAIEENHEYVFEGDFYDHPKYGFQFKAVAASIILPTSKDLVVSFLSGPNFFGIGKSMATKIYEHLDSDDDILNRIIENPELLQGIKGLSQSKVDNIINGIKEHTQDNGLFEFLNKLQIDYNDVIGVFNRAKLDINEFIALISKDPFLLMEKQISFKDIDKFASLLQLDDYEYIRAKAYIYSTVKNLCFKTGSTYLDYEFLFENVASYSRFDITIENFDRLLNNLVDESLIIIEDDIRIYEYEQHEAESFTSEFVLEFGLKYYENDINKYLKEYEEYHGIEFNAEQIQAIDRGVNCPISIVTGGPGTGKSTIVHALISVIKKLDKRMLIGLCAPTGKASKRLTELTGSNSMTIHKMLKFDMHANTFGHNIFNPLDYDVLIVDEASMIDNLLMANLLRACFNVQKIIILGDYNQLPSVSQGQVLKDLIESNAMYVTYLKQIYRQKEGSKVIEMAYKILNNEKILDDFFDDEVRLVNLNDGKEIQSILKEYVNTDNKNNIQILAPVYKGRLGIDNINKNVQRIIFDNDFNFLNINDRVIQLKNRNDDEIYNGDIGKIIDISNNSTIVRFDNKEITYNKTQMIELYLAYCISIHKAQGNEYDEVILFLPNYNLNFMDNKILYTAITRTKKRLTIISNLESINQSIQNIHSNNRLTFLNKLIKRD